MRIVIANCSAIYSGRGATKLPPAHRAIIIKNDGAISIHCDVSNKPLNYMGFTNVHTETIQDDVILWSFDTREENLTVYLHDVISDTEHLLDKDDKALIKDGTEEQLQEWLSEHPEALGDGYTLVQREFQAGEGRVDLLVKDADDNLVIVEVKRVATRPAVNQVLRYKSSLKETPGFENVRAMLAALDFRPSCLELAEKRKVDCVAIDSNWKDTRSVLALEDEME